MGDKAYKKSLAKMRAGTIASRQVLRQDRMNEFGITSDVVSGIYGNLGTSLLGTGGLMTGQHKRQMAALAGLADRQRTGTARDIRQGGAEARNLFGSAIQGLIAPTLNQAAGHAAAGASAVGGQVRAGRTTAAGGQTILGIMAAGALEAQAGARAQTADALMYRAKEDAKLIMEQQSMILQSKLDFQNWKRQQDYLRKLEDKDATGALSGVNSVANLSVEAAVSFRSMLVENPDMSVNDMVSKFTEGDASMGESERFVLAKLAHEIQASVDDQGHTLEDYTREMEAQDIFNQLLLLYPNLKDVREDALLKTIQAGLDAGWSAAGVAAAAAGGGSGNPTDPTYRGRGGYAAGYGPVDTNQPTPTGAGITPGGSARTPQSATPAAVEALARRYMEKFPDLDHDQAVMMAERDLAMG